MKAFLFLCILPINFICRSLLRLSSLLLFDAPRAESSSKSSCPKNEVYESFTVTNGAIFPFLGYLNLLFYHGRDICSLISAYQDGTLLHASYSLYRIRDMHIGI